MESYIPVSAAATTRERTEIMRRPAFQNPYQAESFNTIERP